MAIALDQPPARIEAGLRLVLELCDSAITYRSRYLNVLQPAPVLDLVLADQGNPRGLAFQLAPMHRLLDELRRRGRAAANCWPAPRPGCWPRRRCWSRRVLAAPDQAAAAAALPPRLQRSAAGDRGAVGPDHPALFRAAAGGADARLGRPRPRRTLRGGGVKYRVRHVTTYGYARAGRSGQPHAASDAARAAASDGAVARIAAGRRRSRRG